jgi:UrcA family protein
MNDRTPVTRALPAALAAVAFSLASTLGVAAERAPDIASGPARLDTAQTPLSVRSSNVSLADLDLTTRSGKSQLEQRIRDAASSVCDQLMEEGPATSAASEFADRTDCIYEATQGAMTQARERIAMAQQAKRQ